MVNCMVERSKQFVGGVAAGVGAAGVWEVYPGRKEFEKKMEEDKSPLLSVEHYHVGLALLAADKPFTDGAGAVLFVSEFFHDKPFGVGKPIHEVKGNVTLTSILGGLLLISRCRKR